jgi:hypothetical protein
VETEAQHRIFVLVETSRYCIRGEVTLAEGARLSDYANEDGRDFFAITEAFLAPIEAPERERSVGFILVARHEIGVMMPAERVVATDNDANLYSFLNS